jgi:hypothetical protein
MSFEKLKANSASSISKLVKAAEKLTENKSFGDDRLWAPTVDKAGNGYAVIRFLPAPEGDDLPWVRYWDHGFKGPTGKWYIENSLTSIGQQDPIGELNSKLWNSGLESDKEIARTRKRRLHYVSNILVVSDPGNPSNEGKVMLFKFGKKIFDKIMDVMQPQFQDEAPVNVFDFWAGANFKLKIRNVEGYRNYDKSEFDKPSPLYSGDDKRLESLYATLYPLKDFIDPKNYKSYGELQKKLYDVLGNEAYPDKAAQIASEETAAPSVGLSAPRPVADEDEDVPAVKPARMPVKASPADDEDDGGELSYFAKLARS